MSDLKGGFVSVLKGTADRLESVIAHGVPAGNYGNDVSGVSGSRDITLYVLNVQFRFRAEEIETGIGGPLSESDAGWAVNMIWAALSTTYGADIDYRRRLGSALRELDTFIQTHGVALNGMWRFKLVATDAL